VYAVTDSQVNTRVNQYDGIPLSIQFSWFRSATLMRIAFLHSVLLCTAGNSHDSKR
jgi:hypothetical protein